MTQKALKSIKPKEIKIAVFDIETYKWINPYAVGFYDGKTITNLQEKPVYQIF